MLKRSGIVKHDVKFYDDVEEVMQDRAPQEEQV